MNAAATGLVRAAWRASRVEEYAVDKGPVDADEAENGQCPEPKALVPTVLHLKFRIAKFHVVPPPPN